MRLAGTRLCAERIPRGYNKGGFGFDFDYVDTRFYDLTIPNANPQAALPGGHSSWLHPKALAGLAVLPATQIGMLGSLPQSNTTRSPIEIQSVAPFLFIGGKNPLCGCETPLIRAGSDAMTKRQTVVCCLVVEQDLY